MTSGSHGPKPSTQTITRGIEVIRLGRAVYLGVCRSEGVVRAVETKFKCKISGPSSRYLEPAAFLNPYWCAAENRATLNASNLRNCRDLQPCGSHPTALVDLPVVRLSTGF